MVNDMNR